MRKLFSPCIVNIHPTSCEMKSPCFNRFSDHKEDVTYSDTDIKGRYQSCRPRELASTFILHASLPNKYPRNVPVTPTPQSYKPPSLPTPPPVLALFSASCSFSGGGQRVGGALWCGWEEGWGWGQQCGMLFLWRGDGLKVILIRFTTQTSREDMTALGNSTFMQGFVGQSENSNFVWIVYLSDKAYWWLQNIRFLISAIRLWCYHTVRIGWGCCHGSKSSQAHCWWYNMFEFFNHVTISWLFMSQSMMQ